MKRGIIWARVQRVCGRLKLYHHWHHSKLETRIRAYRITYAQLLELAIPESLQRVVQAAELIGELRGHSPATWDIFADILSTEVGIPLCDGLKHNIFVTPNDNAWVVETLSCKFAAKIAEAFDFLPKWFFEKGRMIDLFHAFPDTVADGPALTEKSVAFLQMIGRHCPNSDDYIFMIADGEDPLLDSTMKEIETE